MLTQLTEITQLISGQPLSLFEYAYNRISDTMPAFLAELERIWPDEGAIEDEQEVPTE
jgi:hypothetical protein